jgi:hypothetical protein
MAAITSAAQVLAAQSQPLGSDLQKPDKQQSDVDVEHQCRYTTGCLNETIHITDHQTPHLYSAVVEVEYSRAHGDRTSILDSTMSHASAQEK